MNHGISGCGGALDFSNVLRCSRPAYVHHKLTIINSQNVQGLVCDLRAALCVFISVDPQVDMVFKTLDFLNSGIREHVKSSFF